ncbi:MAG: hypothetical protein AAFW73_21770 [Bacteroidota bacterium]
MLTTRVQQTLSLDAPGMYLGTNTLECICYGDDQDQNVFYVLPTTIVFKRNQATGGPEFNFYKYTGESLNGGYAIFTTQLPNPIQHENLAAKIKAALGSEGLERAMKGKSLLAVKMCAARAALEADPENADKAADYDKKLGISGLTMEQAEDVYFRYNGDENDTEQFVSYFLPDENKIELKSIDGKNLKASLVINQNEAFYQQIPAPTQPTGGGNNEAVFSLTLSKEGATLFEQDLKGEGGEGSSIGIIYEMDFASSLPAVTVKVTYKSEQFKSFVQTIDRNTWSADEKKITREFTDNEGAKVTPIFGATADEMGMDAQQYADWQEQIRNWGQDQLAQILSSQTGLDMSMDLINDADSFGKFESSLSQTRNFEREYTENTVYNYTLRPQGILTSIESIVGQDKLDSYFHAFSLEDPFFEKLDPEFIINGDFERFNIANVIVNILYKDEPKESMLFEAAGKKKAKAWSVDFNLAEPRDFKYNYTVNFKGDQTQAYHSGDIISEGELIVPINANDSGVVYLDVVNPSEDSWDIFNNIIFKAQYASADPPVPKKEETQLISKTNPAVPFIYPTGVEQVEPVYFQIEYTPKNGSNFFFIPPGDESPTLPNYGATKSKTQYLQDPLIPATLKLFLVGFPEDTQLFLFQLKVTYSNINYTQSVDSTEVVFTGGTIQKEVIFNKMRPNYDNSAVITFTATIISDGGERSKNGTLKPSDTIKVINYKDFEDAPFVAHI